MREQPLSVEILTSLSEISPDLWDSLACPEAADGGPPLDPFTTHRFLNALEESGSVGAGTGWDPCHMLAYSGQDVIGAAPMYLKSHSQGEYIFDHNWAHAYERAGGRYYPKLQIAVPFTPATGRRFLTKNDRHDTALQTLVQGAIEFGSQNKISSLHVTFCTKEEKHRAQHLPLLGRVTQQFHWQNNGYSDFDSFLATLSSRKRKNIRKERSTANDFGGTISVLTGPYIQPEHWDAFWVFHQDTGARKWGQPYLSRAF
ncbi:MAG: peptidogalycan biosysnthesis protein, partial [Paracoccaceae bacterium]